MLVGSSCFYELKSTFSVTGWKVLSISDKKISGMLFRSHGRTQHTLITTVPMAEVASYFSTSNLLPQLRWAIDAAVNAKNIEKLLQERAEQQERLLN